MSIATVITVGDRQLIELPPEIRLGTATVEIRQLGEALLVEPRHSDKWPEGFFDAITITDPAFERPPQGGDTAVAEARLRA